MRPINGGRVLLAFAAAAAVVAVLSAVVPGPSATPAAEPAVDLAAYPYVVSVTGGPQSCGGAVVAATWVLTAAHCVSDAPPGRVYLFLSNGRFVTGTEVDLHAMYDGNPSHGRDVALVQVPTGSTSGITPIQVGAPWDPELTASRAPVVILGIGRFEGQIADIRLRAATAVIRTDDEMTAAPHPWSLYEHWLPELMIGADPDARTACIGDTGAPLVASRDARPVLVGIGSFGAPDCVGPRAFAELAGSQLAWIASRVGPAVTGAWGPCRRPDGTAGASAVTYDDSVSPSVDAGKHWSITCAAGSSRISMGP